MGSTLGPTLANAFLRFYEQSGQNNFLINLNRFIIEDMQMIFLHYLSHAIILLNLGIRDKNGKLSFLHVEVSPEENRFATTVYCKPTFSGVYRHFNSFLPTAYKFSMIYTLVLRCFSSCFNWTNFHNELIFLKDI